MDNMYAMCVLTEGTAVLHGPLGVLGILAHQSAEVGAVGARVTTALHRLCTNTL